VNGYSSNSSITTRRPDAPDSLKSLTKGPAPTAPPPAHIASAAASTAAALVVNPKTYWPFHDIVIANIVWYMLQ